MIVKPYVNGDESKILDLFQLCFGKQMSLEYWNWRFKENPFLEEDETTTLLMWDNDLLVGHYAVSPIKMNINSDIHKTALSMTTMTHPDYGGRGIFTQLASELYSYLENDKGYSMIWGFPNNNSHYGFRKRLDWKDITILPTYSLDSSIPIKHGVNTNIEIKKIVDANILCNSYFTNSLSKNSIYFTKEFCNWRYKTPTVDYFFAKDDNNNSIIYKKYQSTNGVQIDIVKKNIRIDDTSLFLGLLKKVIEFEGEILNFNVWLNYLDDNTLFYEKSGFRPIGQNTYFSCRSNKTIQNDVTNLKKWHIDLCYSDVY